MNKPSVKIYLLILLNLIFSLNALSDEPDKSGILKYDILFPSRYLYYGVYGGLNINSCAGHVFLIDKNNGFLCNDFENGSGLGGILGINIFYPISGYIDISPRIYFQSEFCNFSQNTIYPFLNENNIIEDVTFEDKLKTKMRSINVDLFVSYYPFSFRFDRYNLYFNLGLSMNYFISQNIYNTETIAKPGGVKFLDGSTFKTLTDQNLDFIESQNYSIKAGFGLKWNIYKKIFFNPELIYSIFTTESTKEAGWNAYLYKSSVFKINRLQITLSLLWEIEI
jgi:hypothetical protein